MIEETIIKGRENYESPQVFLVQLETSGIVLTSGKRGAKPEEYDVDEDEFDW